MIYSILVIFVIPIILFFTIRTTRKFINGYKEISRISNISESPIITHFGETINGVQTIRAFKKEKDFISLTNSYLNDKMSQDFWKKAVNRWFYARIVLITSWIFFFTATVWVRNQLIIHLGTFQEQDRPSYDGNSVYELHLLLLWCTSCRHLLQ